MAEQGCAAVVLAAGLSRRLGQAKQLVMFQGETLLRRSVRLALEAGASPVVVVVGEQAEACRETLDGLPVVLVQNLAENAAEGMGSSLRVGMAAVSAWARGETPRDETQGAARVLVMVCDQPLLSVGSLQRLLQAPAPDGIAAALYEGRLGVPAVFGREHFSALAAVTGDQGARVLLRERAVVGVPMPEAAMDIDTPEGLRALQSLSRIVGEAGSSLRSE